MVLLKEALTKLGLPLVGNKVALVAQVTKAQDDGLALRGAKVAKVSKVKIRGMTIVLLKRDLNLLGLSQMGNKPDLVAQLIKARDEGVPYLTLEQAENSDLQVLISHGLPHTAHCELLSQDKEAKFVDELEFNGQHYMAPTTPREEFERMGRGGVVKKLLFLISLSVLHSI